MDWLKSAGDAADAVLKLIGLATIVVGVPRYFLKRKKEKVVAQSASLTVWSDKNGNATNINIKNLSETATAKDVQLILDDVPYQNHPATADDKPIHDLKPGQRIALLFAFTHSDTPDTITVKWTNENGTNDEEQIPYY